MRSTAVRSLVLSLAVALGAGAWSLPSSDAEPLRPPVCDGEWHVTAFPHVGRGELNDVSVLSATDAWAVGSNRRASFAARWDGRRWTEAPIPGLPSPAFLATVSAVSDTDVWAAGGSGRFGVDPLIVHWDGTSWNRVALPDFGTDFVTLTDIAADGTRAWAVGSSQPYGASRTQPLILGWNGHAWTISRLHGTYGGFTDLSGVAIGDDGTAWAVGTIGKRRSRGLLEQWTGTRWYDSGTPFRQITGLSSVDVSAESQVIALGESLHETTRFLSLRGTRRSWTLDHVPFGRSYDSAMEGVAWDSVGTAWAVGWNQAHRDPSSGGGVIERWDGRRWVVVSDPAGGGDALLGVSSAGGVTFAVGLIVSGSGFVPLAERYC